VPLDELAAEALRAVDDLLARAAERLGPRVRDGGALSAEKLEREQRAAHGLAWLATYVDAIRVAMNQGEIVRLGDFGLSGAEIAGAAGGADRRGARGGVRRSRPRRNL
jgi:(2S)-methylsuccinyl-CoA dehydrogenase